MKRPALRQITDACGANVATISRALANKLWISQTTRDLVVKSVKEVGLFLILIPSFERGG